LVINDFIKILILQVNKNFDFPFQFKIKSDFEMAAFPAERKSAFLNRCMCVLI